MSAAEPLSIRHTGVLPAPVPLPAWRRLAVLAGLAGCVLLPAAALHLQGLAGLSVAAPLALGLTWWLKQNDCLAQSQRAGLDAPLEPTVAPSSGKPEAGRLTSQVVPVWHRNIDAARGYAEQSMAVLLESFSGVTNHLDQALDDATASLQLDVGATDTLMETHRAEVDELTVQTRAAMQLKDAMHSELAAFAQVLGEMEALTREVQSIGRATHLLALNASVEANRSSSGSGGGFMVVAQEIRRLAGQSRECGSSLSRHVFSLRDRLEGLDQRFRRDGADGDEVDLRVEQAARKVVHGILGSMASVTRASRQLRLAGHQVKTDIDKIFVSLQSQDRTSQMLGSVTDDMRRYVDWLHGAEDAAGHNPADWLDRLDKSYTMEDMRSSHHGTTSVQQSSTVEFF